MRALLCVVALALAASGMTSCSTDGLEPAGGGPIRFYREYVRVEPSPGRTRVVGLYYFRNTSEEPVETGMVYPFPVDRHHMPPFRIRAWEKRGDTFGLIGFVHGDDSIQWRTSFAPGEEKIVRIEYVQEIKRNHAVYIVTTTKAWGEPIELAEFEFRIPAGLDSVEFSFEPDHVESAGDTAVHFLKRTHFFPDSDLTVTWR